MKLGDLLYYALIGTLCLVCFGVAVLIAAVLLGVGLAP